MLSTSEGYARFNSRARQHIAAGAATPAASLPQADTSRLADPTAAGALLRDYRMHAITHSDSELQLFEKHFTSSKRTMFWCQTYDDVFYHLRTLVNEVGYRSVCFPQLRAGVSQALNEGLFRELGIAYFLADENLKVSDEGELQLFVADGLFADEGSFLLRHMDDQAVYLMGNNKVNIILAPVSSILHSVQQAELLATMMDLYCGPADRGHLITRGSERGANYLFVVDNGRSTLLSRPLARGMLSCLQCGRCEQVCPVAATAGREAYDNVFSGPVASVVLPYTESIAAEKYAPYACTQCGRCEQVCPLGLPLRDMIMESRFTFHDEGLLSAPAATLMGRLKKLLQSRRHLNRWSLLKDVQLRKAADKEMRRLFKLPRWAQEPFAKRYANRQ